MRGFVYRWGERIKAAGERWFCPALVCIGLRIKEAAMQWRS